MELTALIVIHRVRQAWDALRRIPDTARGPKAPGAAWPEFIADADDVYETSAPRTYLTPASPRSVDNMHEVFGWFAHLAGQRDEAVILWLSCGRGLKYTRIARIMDIDRGTVRIKAQSAIARIVEGENRARLKKTKGKLKT